MTIEITSFITSSKLLLNDLGTYNAEWESIDLGSGGAMLKHSCTTDPRKLTIKYQIDKKSLGRLSI